jgi:hypothetical protein
LPIELIPQGVALEEREEYSDSVDMADGELWDQAAGLVKQEKVRGAGRTDKPYSF